MPKVFKKHLQKEEGPEVQESESFIPRLEEAGEVRTLLEWEAPSRPFRKKDRSYYTTIGIIVTLLVLIALLAREFLLILVLLSLTFVTYVLAFVPPHDIKFKISTQGVTIGDQFYFWHVLDSFWFKEKEGKKVLFIQTHLNFPKQLMLVLDSHDHEEEIKATVARFLPFHEIPQTTILERWADGLQKHFPMENPHR